MRKPQKKKKKIQMATSAQIKVVILLYVVTVHKMNTVEMHQVTYPKTFKATTGTTCETAAFLHDFKQHHISFGFFLISTERMNHVISSIPASFKINHLHQFWFDTSRFIGAPHVFINAVTPARTQL